MHETVKTVGDTELTTLYTPTQVSKLGDLYFIVDCWHHRVLYSYSMKTELSKWRILDDQTLAGPHSIASDGQLYVVDNTDKHQLNVYVLGVDGFALVQVVINVGLRPHKVVYCKSRALFYALSSTSQQVYVFKNCNGELKCIAVYFLQSLSGVYCRSCTLNLNQMLICGDNGAIYAFAVDEAFRLVKTWQVPVAIRGLYGLNEVASINNEYYLSATPGVLVKAKHLNDFVTGKYQNVQLAEKAVSGTPYYFSQFDNSLWISSIALPPELVTNESQESSYLIRVDCDSDYSAPSSLPVIIFYSSKAQAISLKRRAKSHSQDDIFSAGAGIRYTRVLINNASAAADCPIEYTGFLNCNSYVHKANLAMKFKLYATAAFYYEKLIKINSGLSKFFEMNMAIASKRLKE